MDTITAIDQLCRDQEYGVPSPMTAMLYWNDPLGSEDWKPYNPGGVETIQSREYRDDIIQRWTDLVNDGVFPDVYPGQSIIQFNMIEIWAESNAERDIDELLEESQRTVLFCPESIVLYWILSSKVAQAILTREEADMIFQERGESWNWAERQYNDLPGFNPTLEDIHNMPFLPTYTSNPYGAIRETPILLDQELIDVTIAYEIFREIVLDEDLYCAIIQLGQSSTGQAGDEHLPEFRVYEHPMGLTSRPYPSIPSDTSVVRFYYKDRVVRLSLLTFMLETRHDEDLRVMREKMRAIHENIQFGQGTVRRLDLTITVPLLAKNQNPLIVYMATRQNRALRQVLGFVDSVSSFNKLPPSMRSLLASHNALAPPIMMIPRTTTQSAMRVGSMVYNGSLVPSLWVEVEQGTPSQIGYLKSLMGRMAKVIELSLTSLKPWLKQFPITNKPLDINTQPYAYNHVFDDLYVLTCQKHIPTVITPKDLEAMKSSADKESRRINERTMEWKDQNSQQKMILLCDSDSHIETRPKIGTGEFVPCCAQNRKRSYKTFLVLSQELIGGQEGYVIGLDDIFQLPKHKPTAGKKSVPPTYLRRIGITTENDGLRLYAAITLAFKTVDPTFNLRNRIQSMQPSDYAPFYQSMWWYHEKGIQDYLLGNTVDTDDIVDGLAHLLGINIFVFEESDTHAESRVQSRIPRFKYAYYPSFYSDRQSICLYRYESFGRMLYEPIMVPKKAIQVLNRNDANRDYPGNKKDETDVYVFGHTITGRLIQRFQEEHSTGIVSVDDGTFSTLDQEPYRGVVDVGVQIIDDYGKRRGRMNQGAAVYAPSPSAPLRGLYVKTTQTLKSTTLVPGRIIEEPWIFYNEQSLRMAPTQISIPGDQGDHRVLLQPLERDPVLEYARVIQQQRLILQVFYWVRTLELEQGVMDLADRIQVDPGVRYNFELSPILGPYRLEDAYAYLQDYGFMRGHLWMVPSEWIRVSLRTMLWKESSTRTDVYVPSFLRGLQNTERAVFSLQEPPHGSLQSHHRVVRNLYLPNPQVYLQWRYGLSYNNNQINAFDLKLNAVRLNPQPFTLTTETMGRQERWIVQNVMGGAFERALNCSIQWTQQDRVTGKRNLGYETPSIHVDVIREALRYTVIYTAHESGRFDTLPIAHEGLHFSILVYPGYTRVSERAHETTITGWFAALLPVI